MGKQHDTNITDNENHPKATSDNTFDGESDPSFEQDIETLDDFEQHKQNKDTAENTNAPHPMLEFPLLYHFFKANCPWLLIPLLKFYTFRWSISYPFIQYLPFTQTLQNINIIFTWTELFMLIPFFICVIVASLYSFLNPSIEISGQASQIPLIFAFVTAMHNSFLTLIFGLPFERAQRYHKLAGRLAFLNSLFHTYVAFFHPDDDSGDSGDGGSGDGSAGEGGITKNFWDFLFLDDVNTSGTMVVFFMACIVITSLPMIRTKVFEFFYYLHILFCVCMVGSLAFHTGALVPILAGLFWGGDLFFRKVLMASFWYPKTASLRVVSQTVMEISFPKTEQFAFNPGQYIFICVPELSIWQWHPFSLSSSPEQDTVTLHIRKAGSWSRNLFALAKRKDQVNICFEGPYGSVGVDLQSNKYNMVVLFSGGIGVTPMQSICNQLMYEHHTNKRTLKKLSFIWAERDPETLQEVDVVRHSIQNDTTHQPNTIKNHPNVVAKNTTETVPVSDIPPLCLITDKKLCPTEGFENPHDDEDLESGVEVEAVYESNGRFVDETVKNNDMLVMCDDGIQAKDQCKLLRKAFSNVDEPLDLQVYLTSKEAPSERMPKFVQYGRPDIEIIFEKLREDAIALGESRVAVCVCAPTSLVNICKRACAKNSDFQVTFDFHSEVF